MQNIGSYSENDKYIEIHNYYFNFFLIVHHCNIHVAAWNQYSCYYCNIPLHVKKEARSITGTRFFNFHFSLFYVFHVINELCCMVFKALCTGVYRRKSCFAVCPIIIMNIIFTRTHETCSLKNPVILIRVH